jgi:methionine-S-sulfoxide reductase
MIKTIYLAGGCFWGVEHVFKNTKGVVSTEVGYAQGHVENPTYEQVCSGNSNHTEVVKLNYDTSKIALSKLLSIYAIIVDPVTLNKQGNDEGTQYRSGIYYEDINDEQAINEFIKEWQTFVIENIVVEVEPIKKYYTAEKEHQAYLTKNTNGYCHINMPQIIQILKKENLYNG